MALISTIFLFSTSFKSARVELIKSIPIPKNFTQGIVLSNNKLIISSGLYGKSYLGKYDLIKQSWINKITLDKEYFAEGLTFFKQKYYQLTWKQGTVLVYDKSLNFIKKYYYQGEGWGLTATKSHFIRSDGSEYLYFHNHDFSLYRVVRVMHGNSPLKKINALQYESGRLWANVWHSNFIFIINLDNYKNKKMVPVVSKIDFTFLVKMETTLNPKLSLNKENVLNGITYDKTSNIFYITGKNWSRIYLTHIFFKE